MEGLLVIKVINRSKHDLPRYQTEGAAGFDVRANIDDDLLLDPLGRTLVPTGLFLSFSQGYEVQIRPRSGLAANHGISVPNAPGTIDSDYRGELKVILVNLSDKPYVIRDGDRVAQAVVSRVEQAVFEVVEELDETDRGGGGFGHTGVSS